MTDVSVKRRFRTSSVTIIISIALVLVMMGLLSVLVLKARDVTTWVKENIKITVFLAPDAKEQDVIELQKSIDAEKWRKSTELVSKDEAAKRLQKDLGEDFIQTLGYNPLSSSIEINLKAEYTDSANVSAIAAQLKDDERVKDVYYQKDMVSAVNERMGSISLVIALFSGALLFIAVGLIFNTIRLSIYSQRFLIRTMDLVGATQKFIRRPFVTRGIINGIVGAVIAIIITTAIVLAIDKNFIELNLIKLADLKTLALLCGLQIVLGILITWISTALAVRKFLRQGTDALYSS
ncbi:MAG TPA: permease-like cell division protein FtsX [Bacteroidia bacterium]|jgi:cell division transport system permease protein|nr:permease-like cell division protein FtsX [Bacteroidia bacterium]